MNINHIRISNVSRKQQCTSNPVKNRPYALTRDHIMGPWHSSTPWPVSPHAGIVNVNLQVGIYEHKGSNYKSFYYSAGAYGCSKFNIKAIETNTCSSKFSGISNSVPEAFASSSRVSCKNHIIYKLQLPKL